MTYTKLGDELLQESHRLSDGAFRTHIEALIWSSLRLLDLRVPKADIRRFADTSADLADVVAELVANGWWQDHGDHWWIGCRWPEWQKSRDWVESKREGAAQRKRTQRARDCEAGKHSADCPADSCPVKLKRNSSAPVLSPLVAGVPNPTQPNPTHVARDVTRDESSDGGSGRGATGAAGNPPSHRWECDCGHSKVVADDDGRAWCTSCGQAAP